MNNFDLYSPFSDLTSTALKENQFYEADIFESPLLNPEQLINEQYSSRNIEEEENELLLEEEIKIGDITFSEADSATSGSEDYREPVSSGNPLIVITAAARKSHISENFLTDELVRAQGGKYTWNYARIDPALIDNLQRLRTFMGLPIEMIDGYYPPKYLRQVLSIKDVKKIGSNPHISGRGAKISVKGFTNNMLDIAAAAIIKCDADIQLSLGNSTIALYVKQPDDPIKKFTSYIADERLKVNTYKFCFNLSSLLSNKIFALYGLKMQKLTGILLKDILRVHYRYIQDIEFPNEIGDVISIMHSQIEDPEVILYALAYSPFGNLLRYYFRDKTNGNSDSANLIMAVSVRDSDSVSSNLQGTFYYQQKQFDKSGFIKLCYDRYNTLLPNSEPHDIAGNIFFDWRHNKDDKIFYEQMKGIIKKVYKDNGYKYEETIQQLPEGGTHSNLVLSNPAPDHPKVDFTGRYYIEFTNDPLVSGSYLLINQSGNYISGKFGSIQKVVLSSIKKINLNNKQPKNLRDTVMEFFGKLNDKGEAVCDLPPQMSIHLRKVSDKVEFTLYNNVDKKILGQWSFSLTSSFPIISNSIMDFLTALQPDKQDLFIALAWALPLPSQLKKFFDFLGTSEKEVEKSIVTYYNIDEDMQSVRTTKLGSAVGDLNYSYHYSYLPNYDQFVNYFTRFYLSKVLSWRPRNDREFMSVYDWTKRMLEDFRDLKGSKNISGYQRLYNDFDVDTEIPVVEYMYEVNLKTSTTGFGPFAKVTGSITIENKTDYKKYPGAEKWSSPGNKVEYSIDFWNISLSLSKWRPKISSSWSTQASGKSNVPYKESDFSGANMDMVEWTAFDLSAGIKTGSNTAGVSTGLSKRFLYIVPRGKKELDLEGTDYPGIPGTLNIGPADKDDKSGFDISLPSVSFFRGEIDTKKISHDISSVPLPEKFEADYKLENSKYFKHDDAVLSQSGIEAIGRMCAEELAALSDPLSELEVIGHTDASGKPEYNLALSAARAANAMQAIEDRLGDKLKAKIKKVSGVGEKEANEKFGQFTEKNAWLRRVVIIINGRAVLSLGQI